MDYFIRPDYQHRAVPKYYADTPSGILWQPDVYSRAAGIARALGASNLIDIGSGNGRKLAELHPEFAVTGIDFGTNLDVVRREYPFGTWLEHNLETEDPLPVDEDALRGSVIICSDVIEHLIRPELLLRKLRAALDAASAVVLSTPERELTWGADHTGPPPNECHTREWSTPELAAFLEAEGFGIGDVELTRSNDAENQLHTILAMLYGSEADMERATEAATASA